MTWEKLLTVSQKAAHHAFFHMALIESKDSKVVRFRNTLGKSWQSGTARTIETTISENGAILALDD
jgi:hypothetical protein